MATEDGRAGEVAGELLLVRPDGTDVRTLVPSDIGVDVQEPIAWSPAGTHIAFVPVNGRGSKHVIATVDVSTGTVTRFAPESGVYRLAPVGEVGALPTSWSPDGSRLALLHEADETEGYVLERGVVIVDIATGTMAELISASITDAVEWSPDGTRLVADRTVGAPSTESGAIVVIDVTSGVVTNLYGPGLDRVGHASWSPDGRRIVFWHLPGSSDEDELMVADLERATVAPITTPIPFNSARDPAWSPDGTMLTLIGANYEPDGVGPFRVVVDTAGKVLLSDEYGSNATWSPDGSRIAYVTESGALPENYGYWQIRVLDVAKSTGRWLVEEPGWCTYAHRWSPDGARVAFLRGPIRASEPSCSDAGMNIDAYIVDDSSGVPRRVLEGAAQIAWQPAP